MILVYIDVQASDIAGGNDGVSEETVIDEQILSTKPMESSRFEFGNFDLNSIVSGPNTAANESHTQVNENGFSKDVSSPERHNTEAGSKDISRAMVDEFFNNILYDTDGSVNSSFLDEEEQTNLDELVRKNHRLVSQVANVDPSHVQIVSVSVPESSSKLVTEPVSPFTKVGEPEAGVPSLMVSGEDLTSSEMVDCEKVDTVNNVSNISIKDLENGEPNGVNDLFSSEVNDFEDESSMKAIVTGRSGQMCTTAFLDDIIENEKTEKVLVITSICFYLLHLISNQIQKVTSVGEILFELSLLELGPVAYLFIFYVHLQFSLLFSTFAISSLSPCYHDMSR